MIQKMAVAIELRIENNRDLQKELDQSIRKTRYDRPLVFSFFPSVAASSVASTEELLPDNADQRRKKEKNELTKNNRTGPWTKSEMATLRIATIEWLKVQLIARASQSAWLMNVSQLMMTNNSRRSTMKFDEVLQTIKRCDDDDLIYRLTCAGSDQQSDDSFDLATTIVPREIIKEIKGEIKEINWSQVKLSSRDTSLINRSDKDVEIIWRNKVRPGLNRDQWNVAEDKKLKLAAQSNDERDWFTISQSVPGRLPYQCLTRYQRSLNPALLHRKWTKEEDESLREAVKKHGVSNWQYVAAELQGRTGQQCLHRYTKALNPAIRKGKWTVEEDNRLSLAVFYYGSGSWSKVCRHVSNRTDMQCRERWENILNPDVNNEPWDEEEDAEMLGLLETLGPRWTAIATRMNNRTDNQCWRRWKTISKKEDVKAYIMRVRKKKKPRCLRILWGGPLNDHC